MKRSKIFILAGAITLISLSSCGIFKKGCGCPHFGKVKSSAELQNKYAGIKHTGVLLHVNA